MYVSPALAFLEVITITPLLASAPYNAVAAAPLRIVMLSILSVFTSVEDILIPSTTYNTSISPLSLIALCSNDELVPEIT